MSAQRLAVLLVAILVVVSSAVAQVNEVSVTAGKSFVSTRSILNPPAGDLDPKIHFGNEETVEFNYGRFAHEQEDIRHLCGTAGGNLSAYGPEYLRQLDS